MNDHFVHGCNVLFQELSSVPVNRAFFVLFSALRIAGVLHLRIVDGKFLSAELAIVFVVVDKPTLFLNARKYQRIIFFI